MRMAGDGMMRFVKTKKVSFAKTKFKQKKIFKIKIILEVSLTCWFRMFYLILPIVR